MPAEKKTGKSKSKIPAPPKIRMKKSSVLLADGRDLHFYTFENGKAQSRKGNKK